MLNEVETIPDIKSCHKCHSPVKVTDYFCYNCGVHLLPKHLSTTFFQQLILYAGCLLLPPLGFIWGYRYLRQNDQTSKLIGIIAIVLTIISLILTIQMTLGFVNMFNTQLNQQLQEYPRL